MGRLGVLDHVSPESWPLREAANLPPEPSSKPSLTCLCLLLTLIPAFRACLPFLSTSLLSCTHTHAQTPTHTQRHTRKAPKALPCWALAGLSPPPGEWPASLYLQALLAQTASKSKFKTEVLNSHTLLFLYPTFSHLQVFVAALARRLLNLPHTGSWPGLMAIVSEHFAVMHKVMWLVSGSDDLFSLPILSQEGGLCLLCWSLCFVWVKFLFVKFSCDREARVITHNLHSFIPSMYCADMLKIFTIFMLSLCYIPSIPRIFGIIMFND